MATELARRSDEYGNEPGAQTFARLDTNHLSQTQRVHCGTVEAFRFGRLHRNHLKDAYRLNSVRYLCLRYPSGIVIKPLYPTICLSKKDTSVSNQQTLTTCPMCSERATVVRSGDNQRTHVDCQSGAEFVIGDAMIDRLRSRTGALDVYHQASKQRRANMIFVLLYGDGTSNHSAEVSGFRPRNKWLTCH